MKRLVIVLIILVLVASPVVGWILYENYEVMTCGIACGPSIDVNILKATLNQTSDSASPENCGIINNGSPQSVVCQAVISPNTSGSIILQLESQNGNGFVAFGDYSSSQAVQFQANYPCMYSSNLPDYNTMHCPVLTSGSTYKFNYVVAQNLSLQEEVVLTIVVTLTCCFP